MHLGMHLSILRDRRQEEVLGPKVKRYAEQYQSRAQYPAVPERQANA